MNKKQQAAEATRKKLITAACQVALEDGVTHLTLEAVAAKAGVSKGGLLYHYPSKEALVAGMVQYVLDDFDETIDAYLEGSEREDAPGRWVRAYLRANLEEDPEELALSIGLLAAIAINPLLLDPWREQYRVWQDHLTSSGVDPITAMIVRFASDGLWFAELLGIAPPDPDLRAQILDRLLTMTQEDRS